MAKPIGYEPDPSGGFRVAFDDGSAMTMATDPSSVGVPLMPPPAPAPAPVETVTPPAEAAGFSGPVPGSGFLRHGADLGVPAVPPPPAPEPSREAALAAAGTANAHPPPVGGPRPPLPEKPPAPPAPVSPDELVTAQPRGLDAGPRPGGGAFGVVPGHWQPTGATIKPGATVDPALMAERERIAAERKNLAHDAGWDANQRAYHEAAIWADQEKAMEAEQANLDAQRVRVQSELEQRTRAFDQATKAAADARIDPGHYFADKSLGTRIGVALAVAIGGAGAAAAGQKTNPAMDALMNAIDRDVEAQKVNLSAKQANVAHARTGVELAQQLGTTTEAWASARRAQMLEWAKVRLQRITAESAPEEVKRNAAAVALDIDEKLAAERERFQMLTRDQLVQENLGYVPPHVVGGNGPVRSEADPELFVPGGGFALSKEDAKDARRRFEALDELDQTVQELSRLTADVGDRASPAQRARAASLQGRFILMTKNAEQMGALDKGAQELGAQLLGDPSALVRPGGGEVLKSLQEGYARSRETMGRKYGLTPGTVEVVPDPVKGGHARIGRYTGQAAPADRPRTLQPRGMK